jgi:hypothetical protein
MARGVEDLDWLLDCQLRIAKRHRKTLSLVMLASLDERVDLDALFNGVVRDCDAFFRFGDQAAIVMAETSLRQACLAVERYKSHCCDTLDFRYAVGSFPEDGVRAPHLISIVYRRLKESRIQGPGAVVSRGEGLCIE